MENDTVPRWSGGSAKFCYRMTSESTFLKAFIWKSIRVIIVGLIFSKRREGRCSKSDRYLLDRYSVHSTKCRPSQKDRQGVNFVCVWGGGGEVDTTAFLAKFH